MGSSLPAGRIAEFAPFRVAAGDRIAMGLETALDAVALLFLPILTVASLGAAPLAIVAAICAAGLVLWRGGWRLHLLRLPALLLGMLFIWGALSAAWSIHPLRSFDVAARLGGLMLGGLALVAAADRLAHPRRLLVCAFVGAIAAMLLVSIELASHGALSALLYRRHFFPTVLNRGAVGLTVLLLPSLVTAICLRRSLVGAAVAVAMTAIVYALKATIAKFILPVAIAAAALILLARTGVIRIAALAVAMLVLTAPLTFSRLAEWPGVVERTYALKESAGHRLEIWYFAGQRIAEKPILGWGLDASRAIPGGDQLIRPGERWLPLHPHNAALQVWLELGAPGAVLFALLAALLWFRLGRAEYPPLFTAAAGGSLLAAMIAAFGSYDLWHEWWIGTLSLMLFLVCVMGSVCRTAAREATRGGESTRSPSVQDALERPIDERLG